MRITDKFKSYTNDCQEAAKDDVLIKLIPAKVSECALHLGRDGCCASDDAIAQISRALKLSDAEGTAVMQSAKEQLSCDTEKCVLNKLSHVLGHSYVKREIITNFKINGPTNTDLLSNIDIDETLKQWSHKFTTFYPYNFNMINYASYSYRSGSVLRQPDSLATVLFVDLISGDFGRIYDCAGCVINSDTYQGVGKHWMALFADTRGPSWTIEFFNSSGNAPAPEWCNWMAKTKIGLEFYAGRIKSQKKIKIIKVTNIRHQQSKTECGLYSLFYIWARLNGVTPEYFQKTPILDQHMFEFRHHLFANDENNGTKFDWNAFTKKNNVEWV